MDILDIIILVILVLLIVVVPIIPAYILYKSLPSRTSVRGPFKGLTIHLTGAFGGYFIVALFISSFIVWYTSTRSKYEVWTIEGNIKPKEESTVAGILFTIKPPHQDTSPNGHFVITQVPIDKKMVVVPDLIIQKGGYATETINLGKENPRYKIEYNKDIKKITVTNDIVLLNLEELPAYDAEKGIVPTPVP